MVLVCVQFFPPKFCFAWTPASPEPNRQVSCETFLSTLLKRWNGIEIAGWLKYLLEQHTPEYFFLGNIYQNTIKTLNSARTGKGGRKVISTNAPAIVFWRACTWHFALGSVSLFGAQVGTAFPSMGVSWWVPVKSLTSRLFWIINLERHLGALIFERFFVLLGHVFG